MKQTQSFRLFQLLKSGEPVSTQVLSETLKIHVFSVPVYIHELKNQFKAEIQSVREGRKVTAYRLLNAGKVKVPEFRKNSYGEIPKAKKSVVSSIAEELEAANTGVVGEREFADIKTSLGLGFGGYSGFGSGNTAGDY
jgi:predicted ArsR family transcriptional regulator